MAKKTAPVVSPEAWDPEQPCPYQIPRIVHRWEDGLTGWTAKRVDTAADLLQAFADGFQLRPER